MADVKVPLQVPVKATNGVKGGPPTTGSGTRGAVQVPLVAIVRDVPWADGHVHEPPPDAELPAVNLPENVQLAEPIRAEKVPVPELSTRPLPEEGCVTAITLFVTLRSIVPFA